MLLDVNALVALAWEVHVHHDEMRGWFSQHSDAGWATCPATESGFVRVSANPRALGTVIVVADARAALEGIRRSGRHRFLTDDVSACDSDVPPISGHRQVTDAHLLTLARRNGMPLVTFDSGLAALGGGDVVLLNA